MEDKDIELIKLALAQCLDNQLEILDKLRDIRGENIRVIDWEKNFRVIESLKPSS